MTAPALHGQDHQPARAVDTWGMATAIVTVLLTVVAFASLLVVISRQGGRNTGANDVYELSAPLALLAAVVLVWVALRRTSSLAARVPLLLIAATAWLLPVLVLASQQLTPGEVGGLTCGTVLDPVRIDGAREAAACDSAHRRWHVYLLVAAAAPTALFVAACWGVVRHSRRRSYAGDGGDHQR